MFLKKLFGFGKDYTHYLEKGDKYLADERFADARHAYGEALGMLETRGEQALPSQIGEIRRKIALTGNLLGRLNLSEAEYAISSGDRKKAGEHLGIIMELADDPALREQAERLVRELDSAPPEEAPPGEVPACGSCEESEDGPEEEHDGMDKAIAGEDRVALYFHTLPGDLPERYAGMGEAFAKGCLFNLEGQGAEALRVFESLSPGRDNDLLIYEKAIACFHIGDSGACEELLLKARGLNPANPLCGIGLVQLYTETGRAPEALQVVERMIAGDLVPEQARLMQGELYTLMKDESNAVESYSKLINSPKYAREAAERLVPLLLRMGRTEEAEYLTKKFSKGR
jgi:tetratricopeptide (TPR) repeat protein